MTLFIALGTIAHAFTEDLCYPGPVECYDAVIQSCAAGDEGPTCRAAAVAAAPAVNGDGRSMVHFDSTYVIVSLLGLSPQRAWTVAAFDQATDIGVFTATDADGNAVADAATVSVDPTLLRQDRNNAGWFAHQTAPRGTAPTNGLEPDVHDTHTEVQVANARAWAASTSPLCVGGFTMGPSVSTGANCRVRGTLTADIPVLDGGPPLAANAALGLVATPILDHDPNDPDARLGVYLHILQDRISHHVCGDASILEDAGNDEVLTYDEAECNQPVHLVRHAYEVGFPETQENARAALAATWDESAALLGVPVDPAARDQAVAKLSQVLSIPGAPARIDAMEALVCQLGITPPQGWSACP